MNNPLLQELFQTYVHSEEFNSGVFSDELDKIGLRHQVISQWKLNNPRSRLFGRVRTLTLEEIDTPDERIQKGLTFLCSLRPSDVLIVKGSMRFAYFGELMTRLSQRTGLGGTIIDGLTRDSYFTQTSEYPIFSKGYTPVDIKGRGRVSETDVSMKIENVTIKPYDYAFGDNDAVVIIPQSVMPELKKCVDEAIRTEVETKKLISSDHSIQEILKVVKEF